MNFPPHTAKEAIKLLLSLGFKETSHGKGSHIKFIHPERKVINTVPCKRQPEFIIVPIKFRFNMGRIIVKEIKCFGFTKSEIRELTNLKFNFKYIFLKV